MKNYSVLGVLNAGFSYLYKNYNQLAKEFLVSILFLLLGTYLLFQPLKLSVLSSFADSLMNPFGACLYLACGACLVIYGTWRILCSCVVLIYSLKEEQDPVEYSAYQEKFNSRKKEFKIALKTLGKYYLSFLIPYVLMIVFGVIFALVGQPLLSFYLLPIGIAIYSVLFFVLIHFAIKTFYIFQIFALEEDLNPKNIVKRCYELTKGHFWYTFGIFICLTLISFIPMIFSIGEVMMFLISLIVTFVLIPLTIVAGFLGYKKIIENIK